MPLDKSAVSALRAEFPALQQTVDGRPIIFFDGPGGTQVHGSVIEAMGRYLTKANSNVPGAFRDSRRTDETTDAAREALADLLNAPRPDEIVFGANMTTLTITLSRAIGRTLAPGDEIVVSRLDHDADIAPWLALQELGANPARLVVPTRVLVGLCLGVEVADEIPFVRGREGRA